MALLNDERGEEVVQERDAERERLKRESQSKQRNVDLWDDRGGQNGAQRNITNDSSEESGDEMPESLTETQVSAGKDNLDLGADESPSNQEERAMSSRLGPIRHVQSAEEDRASPSDLPLNVSTNALFKPVSTLDAQHILQSDQEGIHGAVEPKSSYSSLLPSQHPVVGDFLKMQFEQARVLPCVVNLFFAHPWNNFLHNVVYDILTQVLNGPMDKGYNRQLAIDLFTTGQLTENIVEGQRASDQAQ
jgi:SIT4-associating protein SAP185/190